MNKLVVFAAAIIIATVAISISVLSLTTQANVLCDINPYSVNCECPDGLEKEQTYLGYVCVTPGGCEKGDQPCKEAVWRDAPDCMWDETDCMWHPTDYCPMTCDNAMNDLSWATGIGVTIESEMHEAANFGCSSDGFIEMICKCGIVAGKVEGYDCSDYTGDTTKNSFCSESQLAAAATRAGLSPEQVRQRMENACDDYEGESIYPMYGGTWSGFNTWDGGITVSCHANVAGVKYWAPEELTKVKLWTVSFDYLGNFVGADWTKYTDGMCFRYDEWY